MFGTAHLVFIAISVVLIVFGLIMIRRKKPPIRRLIKVCFILGVIMEAVKVLSVILILPVVEPAVENGVLVYRETGAYAPYLQAEHMPFELCSLQLVFMFLALIIKNKKWKKRIYATMYGTAVIGGVMAILLSSIAPEFESAAAFFSAPRAWQFYLYHSMIVTMGIAIGMSEECDLHFRDVCAMLAAVLILDCASFYVNSLMSIPYYQGDTLVGMGNAINYFSSYNNPLGIVMSTKGQYFLYLAIRFVLACCITMLVYWPLTLKGKRNRKVDAPK